MYSKHLYFKDSIAITYTVVLLWIYCIPLTEEAGSSLQIMTTIAKLWTWN